MARHQVTFRMFWEDRFESWEGFGINRQPAAILVTRDGAVLKKWQGELSEADMAEAAGLARTSS